MNENQMDKNRIGQKQDWTKSFGPNPLDEKVLDENWAHGYYYHINNLNIIFSTLLVI